MGWFDGWFGGGDNSGSASDPLRKLDPKLREFLQKESPIKYATEGDKQHQKEQSLPQKQTPAAPAAPVAKPEQLTQQENGQPLVPRESLYQDGRYAHLWKNYKPISAVDAETKSDHEKLMDVLEGFKERKAQIGGAALENCADEQMEWNTCMKSGDWISKMTMCRKEVQRFERCYMVQSRLLKALGYLQTYDRPPEVDEAIQMRADELYHRMLDQEAAIEKAKAEGLPAPKFPALMDKSPAAQDARAAAAGSATAKTTPTAAVAGTKPVIPGMEEPGLATLTAWKEALDKLPEAERPAEEAALRAEFRAKAEINAKVHALWQEQAKEREARKAEGKETIADKFKGLLGTK
ncbi:hypothetical protein B0H63DRAFT_458637 [Podospora didyma]|uniref:Autophagy-related protein 6 n=1 Tax=Podospora didyma TaxID=330526 RepID=A0AAE0P5H5_9PEZI|nr:hypothetical protein B0H63DRAFT_458637 [Podospora didyma]